MTVQLKRDRMEPAHANTDARGQLLATMPVTERQLDLAGISTAVLEGGNGAPVILLHGPLAYAAHWMRVIPELVGSYRVIAPDLPGHGASNGAEPLDTQRVLAWLDALIEQTCEVSPTVVGQALGGAMAARFASTMRSRLSRLILVDTLGLSSFSPAPEFGRALEQFLADPTENTHAQLWRYCAFDLDSLRRRMGEVWEPFEAYNLARARTPSAKAGLFRLMDEFGLTAIPARELAKIDVPTILIWGRHDLATPISVAEAASERFGWPLHIIEDCADDPPVEQPKALARELLALIRD